MSRRHRSALSPSTIQTAFVAGDRLAHPPRTLSAP
jgi:hypothetical protein